MPEPGRRVVSAGIARKLTGAGAEAESADEKRWYACYTRARHEKQVDLWFGRRGIESYLPMIPRVRQWKDRKKVVDWPSVERFGAEGWELVAVDPVSGARAAFYMKRPVPDSD